MENLEINLKKLYTYLDMKREVAGIKFLFTKEEFDEFPAEAFDSKMAYCTIVRDAMRGVSKKARVENFACMSAAKALGLDEVTPLDDSGKGRVEIGTYKNLCIGRSVSKDMVYCKHQIYGVAIMPLKEFKTEPDVAIIVSEPFNIMRLVQGYAYHNGQVKDVKLAGMQAICQECTSYPFENNCINISMLCAGTRLLSQWKKSEMGMGMPFYMFDEIIDGLENTVNPIERNRSKKIIEEKMKENHLDSIDIIYNKNYDDGLYGGK